MEHRHQRAAFAPRIRDIPQPRIYLAHCAYCDGRGRYEVQTNGRLVEHQCTQCSGRGYELRESA